MIIKFSRLLKDARESGYAVGAFNIFNYLTASAVIEAAEELNSPVIIQISASNVKLLGAENIKRWLFPCVEAADVKAAIHLDHCTDIDLVKECIDEGWTSVMYDGSKLSLLENIDNTKRVVEYAKSKCCEVEGEVGIIKGVEDDVSSDISIQATFDDTIEFVRKTNVDAIAPSVGTAHGEYAKSPKINYELLRSLNNKLDLPIVIHGGTGLDAHEFKRLIKCGGSKINVSTAIKKGYINGIKTHSELVNKPLDIDIRVKDDIKKAVKRMIDTFGSEGKGVNFD